MSAIGVIGVGCIGKGFVEGFLEDGHDVAVYDVDESQVDWALERGADAANDPSALAAAVDVVFLAVPGTPEVEDVMTGDRGVLTGLEAGTLVIDASTTLPETSRACEEWCEERDAAFLEAPITGAAPRDGKQVMVGGREDAYERAEPLLDSICAAHVRVGECGRATVLKLGLQLRYAGREALDAEVVSFLEEGDVDPTLLSDFFGMDVSDRYRERDFSQEIEGLGGLRIWHKDVGYAREVAGREDVALPLAGVLHEAYKATVRNAGPSDGHPAALRTYWDRLNGRDR